MSISLPRHETGESGEQVNNAGGTYDEEKHLFIPCAQIFMKSPINSVGVAIGLQILFTAIEEQCDSYAGECETLFFPCQGIVIK